MRNELKDKIRSCQATLGSWITIPHPVVAEIMAKAGFDWLAVDLEHTMTDLGAAGHLLQVIDLCGVSPLVRLTNNDRNQIKRLLDAGAHGIIVPMVNTPEDAAAAVAATRYMPEGNRGVGLFRAQQYGHGFRQYLEWQKSGAVVIVQIEHISALENLSEILAVDGVDGLMIGPYDLSCSMGIPGNFSHPDFVAAIAEIRKAAERQGICSGIHIVEPDHDSLVRHLAEGYRLIAYGVDMRVLDTEFRKGVDVFRSKV